MNESQPVLRYNVHGPVQKKGEERETSAGATPPTALGWGVLVVCLSVWAVVGAVFWVPLLLRRIVTYSVALVPSMLAGKKPGRAAEALHDAMSFYGRGFRVTAEVVTRQPEARDRGTSGEEEDGLHGLALLDELAWVLLIWYAILLMVGIVDRTPLDLWRWLADFPWTEKVLRPAVEWGRSLPGA